MLIYNNMKETYVSKGNIEEEEKFIPRNLLKKKTGNVRVGKSRGILSSRKSGNPVITKHDM